MIFFQAAHFFAIPLRFSPLHHFYSHSLFLSFPNFRHLRFFFALLFCIFAPLSSIRMKIISLSFSRCCEISSHSAAMLYKVSLNYELRWCHSSTLSFATGKTHFFCPLVAFFLLFFSICFTKTPIHLYKRQLNSKW